MENLSFFYYNKIHREISNKAGINIVKKKKIVKGVY